MRAIPFDAKLAEAPDRGNERFAHYDLEIAGVRRKRRRTFLQVPCRPGPHDAEVISFAPDLSVPLIVDGGFYDGLSPAPGILAFHNGADKGPFRRCLLHLGGHGFFPPEGRRRAEAELEEFLGRKAGG